ncbi:RNase adapter RapZ [soil metagenome]
MSDRPDRRSSPAGDVSRERPHVAIITGLSGAGKTATSKLFEDLGYRVVDNLPSELLPDLAELVAGDPTHFQRVALVLDVRSGDASLAFGAAMGSLEGRGIEPQVFFLEARDEVLIRRFSESRHRHPLAELRGSVAGSVAVERQMLEGVREQAHVIIDTSELSGRQLRERIQRALSLQADADTLPLQLISFGFKYGIPLESDVVFDVRFMENPHYIEALRPHSGLAEPTRDFVLGQPVTQRFLGFVREFFSFTIPAYQAEGKTRLTVAIGCTGGYHRSVAISERVAQDWREAGYGSVDIWHRELDRD